MGKNSESVQIDMLLERAAELVCISLDGKPLAGKAMQNIDILNDMSVAIDNGRILEIGLPEKLRAKYSSRTTIDCSGKVVTPGFIDPHTHPVFVNTREEEFEQRLQGKTYVEISQSGGGIRSTIRTTRNAAVEELTVLAAKRVVKMLQQGTTTLEAKSGYGLTTESELRQLEVISRLADILPVDIVPTFMGAHEFPEEYKNKHLEYIGILCNEMIPAVAEQGIARYCDIFTEAHVYNLEESRQVLKCARQNGLKLKMHADEIEPMGGAELAAELGCVSADHLGMTSDAGITALKQAGVVPVLLPATLFSLGSKTYARARDMIEKGLPVALATDFNPGSCNCDSIPLVMTIACLQMKMLPSEAMAAVTVNAAAALNLETKLGSISVGKQADILIWDIPSYKYIPYHMGSSNPETVIKRGMVLSFPIRY
jgi:imidazolonepropionase